MKKKKLNIRFAWIVLICFIAGQAVVFSHQHFAHFQASTFHTVKAAQPVQTVTDKCEICDMMHNSHMAIFTDGVFSPLVSIINTHYTRQHDYVGIALILSAGRSPPRV